MKKRIIAIVFTMMCMCMVHAQKTAHDYFNMSSQLYIQGNEKEALTLVKRGLEVYETDEQLKKLLEILQKKDNSSNQNQQQNQNNDQNNSSDENKQDNSQNGNQDNNNQNKEQNKEQNSQSGNQQDKKQDSQTGEQKKQEQGKKSEEKPGEKGKEQYVKGQISELEAEMLLRAIENNERAIQLKLQKQKQEQQRRQSIEKNW